MIIRSHSDLPEMDEARRVAAVVSLPGTFARSVGATLADVPALFADPSLDQGHARMTGRWAMPAHAFGPLQKISNYLLFDAQAVALEYHDDLRRNTFSALTVARAVLLQTFHEQGDEDFVEAAVSMAGETMKYFGPSDDERADRGERYAVHLPQDRMVELVDPGTVESVLAVMVGLQRADLVACGVPKSTAAGYLNGREDWQDAEAYRLLIERIADSMARISAALPMADSPADADQRAAIHALTPAQTCTMWQLFPIARPEIERWSPWMFKFGDPQ